MISKFISKQQRDYMSLAIELAKKGQGFVAPNPMVGAVIVKEGEIIGQGYHQKLGDPHAEVLAIESVKDKTKLKGATLYVTLEPCRHYGKTPPCWNLIQSVGITEVFCGSADPLHGKEGSESEAEIELNFLDGQINDRCRKLNRFFFCWAEKKRPFITVKVAISADGYVAKKDGQPVHLTSKKQDDYVHQLRAQHQAIMVGSQTVINDNPHLGVRHVEGADPLRIILDSNNRVPQSAQVFRDENVMHINHPFVLIDLLKELAQKNITSILVEPGPTLYKVLKDANLIDEFILLESQKVLGEGMKIEL